MEDSYRHKGMRKRLIQTIREKGISDEKVLEAMYQVPRHFFLDNAFEELAYEDQALPIGKEQTISQPYTVAYQSQLLEAEKRMKVLEIGTGSGYQAAVLGKLGLRVYTLERHKALYLRAKEMMEQLQLLNVRCYFKDGNIGLGEFAPFDRILVTCGATEVPEPLLKQLKIGGFMVIPVGEQGIQVMYKIKKITEKDYLYEKFDKFRFVPLLKGKK